MLRRSESPIFSLLPALGDDPALFDPSPEWSVRGLGPSLRKDMEDDDGLGFRSLIEQPEALLKAWRTAAGERSVHRAPRAKLRHARRSRRWSQAA
jgi:hypothetical protein